MALRAWSQPDALPRLQSLQSLTIQVARNPIEDRNTLGGNMGRFRRRVSTLRSEIKIYVQKGNGNDPESQWLKPWNLWPKT